MDGAAAALRQVWPQKAPDEVLLQALTEALAPLPPKERVEHLTALFSVLASSETKAHWPRACRVLLESQPPEVRDPLEVFGTAARVLESGDLSLLDPLAPEQREIVQEVLRRFGENKQEVYGK
jgi:hypothetical protein